MEVRLRVLRADGRTEVITLVPPVTVTLGNGIFNILSDAASVDHYFTADGIYDGWGRAINATLDDAGAAIESFETSREIEDEAK